jgi:hypothetical protein
MKLGFFLKAVNAASREGRTLKESREKPWQASMRPAKEGCLVPFEPI